MLTLGQILETEKRARSEGWFPPALQPQDVDDLWQDAIVEILEERLLSEKSIKRWIENRGRQMVYEQKKLDGGL